MFDLQIASYLGSKAGDGWKGRVKASTTLQLTIWIRPSILYKLRSIDNGKLNPVKDIGFLDLHLLVFIWPWLCLEEDPTHDFAIWSGFCGCKLDFQRGFIFIKARIVPIDWLYMDCGVYFCKVGQYFIDSMNQSKYSTVKKLYFLVFYLGCVTYT